jgi:alcohol dehydrogenase (cytochrome c)
VFFGDDSGSFAAADAVSGKVLWSFQANANWRASPMTYQFDGQQYIALRRETTFSSSASSSRRSRHAGDFLRR